ncbi:phosphatidylinositol-specific phospholipase C domain-containing protein [Kitasatospora sp. NPDC058190]|uniref:phosphatidylinositol-specific phospholipase C domain-containing protein n=1 Tax=Kitasatospora sp. NPDC058190 TaxID=3346371 RepID=UPI0036DCB3A2
MPHTSATSARPACAALRRLPRLRRLTRTAMVTAVATLALAVAPLAVPHAALAEGTDNRDAFQNLGSADQQDWMGKVGATTPLTAMSIPGTHETLAVHGGSSAQTQQDFGDSAATLSAQLDRGIRAVDIRVRIINDKFVIHHGPFYQNANFDDVLTKAKAFLSAHRGETLLMRLRAECDGSTFSCTDDHPTASHTALFDAYAKQYAGLFYNNGKRSDPPTLGQARGKIVLSVFNADNGGSYGLNGFGDHTEDTWAATDAPAKWSLVSKNLAAAGSAPANQTFVTYTSASRAPFNLVPSEYAGGYGVLRGKDLVWVDGVNVRLMNYLNNDTANRRLGIVMMDYPGWALVHNIIARNAYYDARGTSPAIWLVKADKTYVDSKYGRCMTRGPQFDSSGQGGVVQQRACQSNPPSSQQWQAAYPSTFDSMGYYWIKAANGQCLTVPWNNGTPPSAGTQLFWWPCETRWISDNQMWNIMPTNLANQSALRFINKWTNLCLMVDPATASQSGGKVVLGNCPA